MSTDLGRDFVRFALSIGALELMPDGRRLKSGRDSPYFFNSGVFSWGPAFCKLVNGYVDLIMPLDPGPDIVFGPAYKGIPIASAIVFQLASRHERNVGYVHNRKEVKDHGEGGILVGASLSGFAVTLVDDVMTTGGSLDEAAGLVDEYGGVLNSCVIAFDRCERGEGAELSATQAFSQKHNVEVLSIATVDDLLSVMRLDAEAYGLGEGMYLQVLEYYHRYGI